ncbi:PREDICTED: trem-like transcript 2 protein [Condylura cristata]|uniref:trem-like transcript 2 protein n=1 Tax=Condylura cristata TaxID=143302 RepID=UPI00033467A6|nr:PREDICTED: trem-like transcript 2 protein [Condylura cristata]
MAPTLPLLLLLWLQGRVSGAPAESVYSRVKHLEGETLSVQCSYKSRKNHVEGKVWCKIRRNKCEPRFTRVGAQGPRYLLQDDVKARVVYVTMAALRRQDSGRYWCMRNSSGTLYPLMGFQLEVSPAPTTKRNTPLTHLANILKSDVVITTDITTDQPLTSEPVFKPGLFTLARLWPSTTFGTIRLSSMTGYSFTSTGTSPTGPSRTTESQTASPSHAAPMPTPTEAGRLRTGSPTAGMCHTSRSLLNELSPIRPQDPYLVVVFVVLVFGFLLLLAVLIVGYGSWKKRHMGSYSICSNPARPWKDLPRRPEPLWNPAWS